MIFKNEGQWLGKATLLDGAVVLMTRNLPPGTRSITATYIGNSECIKTSAADERDSCHGSDIGNSYRACGSIVRRWLYCGEWIESHVLHVYMLHAPDFLGYQDVIAMAKDHRSVVERGLRLKKIGNRVVSVLGGREIHPVSAAVGGFYKAPTKYQLRELVGDLEWALQASLETVLWTANLEFPDFEQDYEFVALRHPDEYPLDEGRLVSNRGLDIDTAAYEDNLVEMHVKHSNALHSVIRGRDSYVVGPLARFNLNFDKLPQEAQQAAFKANLMVPVRNPFRSIVVRAVEMVFACAGRRCDSYASMSRLLQLESKHRIGPGWGRPSLKRRGAFCITAMLWTNVELSLPLKSFRPLLRIRKELRTTCATTPCGCRPCPSKRRHGSASRRFGTMIRAFHARPHFLKLTVER